MFEANGTNTVDKSLWIVGDKPLITWGDVCRMFENDKMEQRHPGWRDTLKTCAVFDFTNVAEEDMLNSPESDHELGNFGTPLPFPTIAVCTGWSIIVAKDFWINPETEIMGAAIIAVSVPYLEYAGYYHMVCSGRAEHDLTAPANPKNPDIFDPAYSDVFAGRPRTLDLAGELRPYQDGEFGNDRDRTASIIGGLFWNLVRMLWYLNQPTRFIVTQTPDKLGKTKKGKIPRLHSRPHYIVLEKAEIKKRYLNSQPTARRSPMPHLRRGHLRTLTAARHKEPGKRVWVRATHVAGNTVEWREGDRIYKVI